jgi:hypothetical protein
VGEDIDVAAEHRPPESRQLLGDDLRDVRDRRADGFEPEEPALDGGDQLASSDRGSCCIHEIPSDLARCASGRRLNPRPGARVEMTLLASVDPLLDGRWKRYGDVI